MNLCVYQADYVSDDVGPEGLGIRECVHLVEVGPHSPEDEILRIAVSTCARCHCESFVPIQPGQGSESDASSSMRRREDLPRLILYRMTV